MTHLLLGLSLGLSAGLAPGPLLALVIQRSVQGGLASGLRVSLAPLLSDLPIVVLAILLVGRMPSWALDGLMIVGALFVLWLGIDALRNRSTVPTAQSTPATARQDLWHGALINLLNPHPYLFWAIVGAPTVVRAWRTESAGAIAFVIGFYLLLIGSKMALAFVFSRTHTWPAHRHRQLMSVTAVMLLAAGCYMLYTGGKGLLHLL